jgi:cell division FtsZ-interacting protein ZapD
MNLKNDSQQDFQQFSQNRDVEDFTTLVFSVSTQKLLEKQREQMKQQLAKQLESQKQKYDQQIKQMNLQLNALIKQMQSSEKRED